MQMLFVQYKEEEDRRYERQQSLNPGVTENAGDSMNKMFQSATQGPCIVCQDWCQATANTSWLVSSDANKVGFTRRTGFPADEAKKECVCALTQIENDMRKWCVARFSDGATGKTILAVTTRPFMLPIIMLLRITNEPEIIRKGYWQLTVIVSNMMSEELAKNVALKWKDLEREAKDRFSMEAARVTVNILLADASFTQHDLHTCFVDENYKGDLVYYAR